MKRKPDRFDLKAGRISEYSKSGRWIFVDAMARALRAEYKRGLADGETKEWLSWQKRRQSKTRKAGQR